MSRSRAGVEGETWTMQRSSFKHILTEKPDAMRSTSVTGCFRIFIRQDPTAYCRPKRDV